MDCQPVLDGIHELLSTGATSHLETSLALRSKLRGGAPTEWIPAEAVAPVEPELVALVATEKRRRGAGEEPHWTADEAARSQLFSPLPLGPLTMKQRTWVPAMVPWRASDEGMVTPDVIEWYARFAAGRPGVLVVEATGIRDMPSGPLLRIGHERFVPGLRSLCDAVRDGRLITAQTWKSHPEFYREVFSCLDSAHVEPNR
jgi:hypothetical protein